MTAYTEIKSRDNVLIKLIPKLQKSARVRREQGLFVLEGLRICLDAAENGVRFQSLIVSAGAAERYADRLDVLSACAEQCVRIPDALFERIGDTDSPQGVIALAYIPQTGALLSPDGYYIGLENLTDPSNLGAVTRTAEALGISGILISGGSCDPYSPKALRASMGTLLRVPLFETDNLCVAAHQAGLRVIACVVDPAAEALCDITFSAGDVLLIGNEANGLKAETRRAADRCVTIPMRGRAESLNAAAAAAIAIWEMMRGC